MTTSLSRGISRSMFLRLWVRAPLTIIVSINHLTAARVKEETKHPIIRKSLAKSCQETCFCRQDRETGNRLASHSPLLIESPLFIRQDRKSTRLNSSHVKISYAVFCLKKKKKI